MEQTGALKLLFAINPVSGGKGKTDFESAIKNYFKPLPHSIEFFLLSGKGDGASLKHWIEKIKPDRVVAIGGDGTVTLVAKQLIDSPIALGILPAGSANGMAKELDIPVDITEALDVLVNGKIKCCDLIKVNDEICLHLSDIGLNAQLVKYFDEGNMRGKLGYARVVLKVLWNKRLMNVTIQTKEKQIDREAFMIVLANASKYGTGAVINPGGNLYDGLFEVVVIRRLAISELFKMWFNPKPFNPKKIEVFQASSASIETSHKVHFQVDGEYLGKVDKVVAVIMPAKLNIVLPVTENSSDN